jgi:hypothetical protein
MNIDPLSNSNINPFARRHTSFREQPGDAGSGAEGEIFSAERSASVRDTLAALPEIRPEVVARGRQLLADANYPGPDIVSKIASLITPLPEYGA